MGYDIPGLSKSDLSELVDIINADGKLKAFADQILSVTKGDGYVKPSQEWLSGTITTDLIDLLNTTKRRKYLEQSGYLDNANEIFSEEKHLLSYQKPYISHISGCDDNDIYTTNCPNDVSSIVNIYGNSCIRKIWISYSKSGCY